MKEVVDLAHGSGCVAVSIPLGWGNSVEVMEGGRGIMEMKEGEEEIQCPEDILSVPEK